MKYRHLVPSAALLVFAVSCAAPGEDAFVELKLPAAAFEVDVGEQGGHFRIIRGEGLAL